MSTQPQARVTVTTALQLLLTADTLDVALDLLRQLDHAGDVCVWEGEHLVAVRFRAGDVLRLLVPRP